MSMTATQAQVAAHHRSARRGCPERPRYIVLKTEAPQRVTTGARRSTDHMASLDLLENGCIPVMLWTASSCHMPLFGFYIMVDWSGGARRRRGRSDTIWIAHGPRTADTPHTNSPHSRTEAIHLIEPILEEAIRSKAARSSRLSGRFCRRAGVPKHVQVIAFIGPEIASLQKHPGYPDLIEPSLLQSADS
jgi:hypothetical protein